MHGFGTNVKNHSCLLLSWFLIGILKVIYNCGVPWSAVYMNTSCITFKSGQIYLFIISWCEKTSFFYLTEHHCYLWWLHCSRAQHDLASSWPFLNLHHNSLGIFYTTYPTSRYCVPNRARCKSVKRKAVSGVHLSGADQCLSKEHFGLRVIPVTKQRSSSCAHHQKRKA